jgi:hypothetical protein
MKRTEIIEKLLSEGFTEKTLSRLSDNQLTTLAKTVLSEEDVMISKKDPQLQQKVANAKKSNQTIVTYEEEEKDGEENKSEIEEWVLNLAESKFSHFTSKSDIMGIITEKVKEAAIPMPATKATKGHNDVPEFMTFDAIVGAEPAPTPAQPEVIPDAPPTEKPSKPKTPYQPGPGTDPKPKAMGEEKKKK